MLAGIRVSSVISMWRPLCEAGTTWARRGMCAEAGQGSSEGKKKEQLPSMESKLRKLYLRVHPDLFSSYPNAKKANEKSFQRLTEFLSTVKQGSVSTMQTSTQSFPMEFYMRPVADKSNVKSEEDLERVEITLRNSGSVLDKQKQLRHLFKACGLGEEFAVDAESAGFSRHSLQGFLYDVAAEAAQRKIEKSREMRDLIARQHMLHLHHNVRVTLSACKGSGDRLATLDKMLNYDVLDVLSKLGKPSVHCIIGNSYGIDPKGGIILDKNGDIDRWCWHIAGLQLHDMMERSESNIASVREAEARAAKHMGLQYIHAEGTIEYRSEYSRLLSEVVGRAPKVEEAKRTFRRASGAVLLVQEELPADTGCDIEEQRGTILASLSCDPESLVGFVLDHGHRVARMRDNFMKRQRLLSDSLVEAKRALGISDLDVDRSVVSDEEAIECFQRLATSAGTLSPPTGLAPLVQGVSLCVGDEYLLKEDGTIVIPHDFDARA